MSAAESAQKLRELVKRLAASLTPAERAPAHPLAGVDPPMHILVYSFMLWERDPAAAAAALASLYNGIIDPNELRVALPEEIAAWCADTDALALERAARLRACLNDLYRREHAVSLERVAGLSKREAREYLDSLEGIPPFVAARVSLFGFGGHAVPVDRRLHGMLERESAVEVGSSLVDAERWLERQVRASEAEGVVLLLEAWREEAGRAGKSKSAPRGKGPGKKAPPSTRTTPPRSRSAGERTGKRGAPKRPKKDS